MRINDNFINDNFINDLNDKRSQFKIEKIEFSSTAHKFYDNSLNYNFIMDKKAI